MNGRVAAALGWIALVIVAFGAGLPSRPDQGEWIVRLLTGAWEGENPTVIAHFQMMGLWPLAMAALWRREWWRPGHLPAWPFLAGSFVVGCFALLPYAALRARPEPPAASLMAGTAPAWVWAAIAAGFVGFGAWAAIAGDVPAWWAGVHTDAFLWAMSWDFAAFVVLFAAEARRLSAQP